LSPTELRRRLAETLLAGDLDEGPDLLNLHAAIVSIY
jgi:hypothetical protein